MRLAIVDDNEDLLDSYVEFFSQYYTVYPFNYSVTALEEISKRKFDLVILDYRMPDITGVEILEKLRGRKIPGNYFFHTQNFDEGIEEQMRSLGALDVLYKHELYETNLRRLRHRIELISKSRNTYWGGVLFNDDLRAIEIDEEKIKLTDIEYRLFRFIVYHDTDIVTRSAISASIWEGSATPEMIDFQISSIRKKLGKYSGLLKTRKNQGYYLNSLIWDDFKEEDSDSDF